ncbi:MAG: hypothetical protein ACI81G_000221 [Gammaproteobacteria bacterium]|jgi:hypothetical protein
MKSYLHLKLILGVLSLIICVSCVKDVDFDQAEEIIIAPKVDLDLVFFNLGTDNFVASDAGIPVTVIRDTTRLEFLDDTFVRENLLEIDFVFRYDNSFPQVFEHRALFLDEEDEVLYAVTFDVDPSLDGMVTTTLYTQTVAGPDLDAIRNSIKMLIELTLEPNGDPVVGALRHQSKALYSLEFGDL